jgi:hypothetical protein
MARHSLQANAIKLALMLHWDIGSAFQHRNRVIEIMLNEPSLHRARPFFFVSMTALNSASVSS